MNARFTFYLSLILGIIYAQQALSQEFEISGEYKPRAEVRNGVWKMRPADDSYDKAFNVISQRARLNFNYANKDSRLRFGAQLQDVRTWGSTPSMNVDNPNSFDIHQFWGEILFTDNFSAKVGRQEISYDTQRIFGAVDWAQQARSFDALVFKLEDATKGFRGHLGLSYNTKNDASTIKQPYDIANYKSLQYLWLNKKFNKSVSGSFLFLNNGWEYTVDGGQATVPADRKIAYSQTIGAVIDYTPAPFGFIVEGYYQTGKNTVNRSLAAWDVRADLNYKLGNGWTLNGGAEWLSGNDQNSTDNKDHAFNPFYGTNHKFNGYMDYFYVGGRHQAAGVNVGLADYFIGTKYTKDKLYGELTLHKFGSMGDIFDASAAKMTSNLGVEGDMILGYRFSKEIDFQGGFSVFSGSSSLERLQAGTDNGKLNTWGFLQITIKPTFFTFKK